MTHPDELLKGKIFGEPFHYGKMMILMDENPELKIGFCNAFGIEIKKLNNELNHNRELAKKFYHFYSGWYAAAKMHEVNK